MKFSKFEHDTSRPLREDEIYAWFVRNSDRIGLTDNPIVFVELLVDLSVMYANFTAGKNPDGTPNRYLHNIATLSGQARQHFILLLAGHHLPTPLFMALCGRLEQLFFCYVITREPTKNFERVFAQWAADLSTVMTQDELDRFIADRITADLVGRGETFGFTFGQLDQTRVQQYRLRYILAKLTQYVEEQAWHNAADADLDRFLDKSVHIEHILPVAPSAELRAGFDQPGDMIGMSRSLGIWRSLSRPSIRRYP